MDDIRQRQCDEASVVRMAGKPVNDLRSLGVPGSKLKIVGAVVAGDRMLAPNVYHPLASLAPDQRRRAARRAVGRLVVLLAAQSK